MKKVCDSNSSGHISNTGASRTNKLLMAGLFSALTGVCSWININLFFTPVPVNMALMGPYLAGLMLGCRYGFFSQIIYILLGVLGIPVFAGFTSGAGIIAGPTGGFIVGYVICAVICGLPARKKGSSYRIMLMICGLIACYALGLAWFMILTHSTLWAGLVACVIPFLPGDAVKIALAAVLSKYLVKASLSL